METQNPIIIEGFDFEEVLKMNSILDEIEDIFDAELENKLYYAQKILFGGVEWKKCGIPIRTI